MTQLIKSLRWHHARKSAHILLHLGLFFWIVTLMMNTTKLSNQDLFLNYIGISFSALVLFRINQGILKDL